MMGLMRLAITLFGMALISAVAGAAVSPQTVDRKATFNLSIPDKGEFKETGGTLFNRVKYIFQRANSGSATEFNKFLTAGAELKLSHYESKLVESRIDGKIIRAIMRSCYGPYQLDETSSWVQISWVCRVDQSAPISSVLKFRESPELTMLAVFERGRIKELFAMEPLPVVGKRFMPMDAYERLRVSKSSEKADRK